MYFITVANTYRTIDVIVQANVAYISSAKGGLTFIDISDPINPQLLGSLPVDTNKLKLENNRIYTLLDSSIGDSILIIDVSNPRLPRPIGTGSPWGWHWDAFDVMNGQIYLVTYLSTGSHLSIMNVNAILIAIHVIRAILLFMLVNVVIFLYYRYRKKNEPQKAKKTSKPEEASKLNHSRIPSKPL